MGHSLSTHSLGGAVSVAQSLHFCMGPHPGYSPPRSSVPRFCQPRSKADTENCRFCRRGFRAAEGWGGRSGGGWPGGSWPGAHDRSPCTPHLLETACKRANQVPQVKSSKSRRVGLLNAAVYIKFLLTFCSAWAEACIWPVTFHLL